MREQRVSLLETGIKEDFSEEEASIYLDTCQMRRGSREEARAEARGRVRGPEWRKESRGRRTCGAAGSG